MPCSSSTMTPETLGIYIHVPFCRSKCPYCDFYSLKSRDAGLFGGYSRAVASELASLERSSAFADPVSLHARRVDTVYFGGGTPSRVGAAELAFMLCAVRENFDLDPDAEITAEVNPADASPEFFRALRKAGFDRVSMGLQSAVDTERRALGRLSGADDVRRAVADAREAGFGSISLDLMLGVPGQTVKSLRESLDFVAGSDVGHVSAYMLRIEPGTPFERMRDRLPLASDDEVAQMYDLTARTLAENGFEQYEISNFARPGFESRHNLKYWRLEDYLGVGPAAHSMIGSKRFFQPPDLDAFLAGGKCEYEGEGGGADEYLMLSLRLREGVDIAEYVRRGGRIGDRFDETVGKLTRGGLARPTPAGFALTPAGMAVQNAIILEISRE